MAAAGEGGQAGAVGVERWTVYLLLSAQIMNNLAIRFGLPALIFFMQQEFNWSPTQLARVTGSFFPGYMLTQIPAGWIANRFGGKDILTVNMAGNALLLCALPAAAKLGQGALCAALSVMGAFQGPLIPAQGAIKAAWLQGLGAERPFVLRVMGLGSKVASTLTGLAVPALATSRWGWRLVPYVYGIATAAMAVAWHCLAANAPRSVAATAAAAAAAAQPAADVSEAAPAAKAKAKTSAEWGIMGLLPVQATMWAHIVDNTMTYTMNQMG